MVAEPAQVDSKWADKLCNDHNLVEHLRKQNQQDALDKLVATLGIMSSEQVAEELFANFDTSQIRQATLNISALAAYSSYSTQNLVFQTPERANELVEQAGNAFRLSKDLTDAITHAKRLSTEWTQLFTDSNNPSINPYTNQKTLKQQNWALEASKVQLEELVSLETWISTAVVMADTNSIWPLESAAEIAFSLLQNKNIDPNVQATKLVDSVLVFSHIFQSSPPCSAVLVPEPNASYQATAIAKLEGNSTALQSAEYYLKKFLIQNLAVDPTMPTNDEPQTALGIAPAFLVALQKWEKADTFWAQDASPVQASALLPHVDATLIAAAIHKIKTAWQNFQLCNFESVANDLTQVWSSSLYRNTLQDPQVAWEALHHVSLFKLLDDTVAKHYLAAAIESFNLSIDEYLTKGKGSVEKLKTRHQILIKCNDSVSPNPKAIEPCLWHLSPTIVNPWRVCGQSALREILYRAMKLKRIFPQVSELKNLVFKLIDRWFCDALNPFVERRHSDFPCIALSKYLPRIYALWETLIVENNFQDCLTEKLAILVHKHLQTKLPDALAHNESDAEHWAAALTLILAHPNSVNTPPWICCSV